MSTEHKGLSTPRLRELELMTTSPPYTLGQVADAPKLIEGYKLCLADVAPVLAAAARAEVNLETCPHCLADIEYESHNQIDDEDCPLGALRDALSAFKGEAMCQPRSSRSGDK